MNWLKKYLNQLYLNLGLALGLINDDPDAANFRVKGIVFNPPQKSTLKVGEHVEVTVIYSSNLTGYPVQIWVYPSSNEFGGTYEASDFEPANGRVSRHFQVASVGHLDEIEVHIQHYSGETMLTYKKQVDFTFVENAERSLLKTDGAGAKVKIYAVKYEGFALSPNGKVKVRNEIEVVIDYEHTAEHGVNLWAMPYAEDELSVRYDDGRVPKKKQGRISKFFEINEPALASGIHVVMTNTVDEVIAEQFLEFPIHFYNA